MRAVGAGAEGLEPEDGVSPPRAGQGGWGWRICPLPLRDGAAQALQQHRGRAGRLSPGARGAAGGGAAGTKPRPLSEGTNMAPAASRRW